MFFKPKPIERDADGNPIPPNLGPLDAPLPQGSIQPEFEDNRNYVDRSRARTRVKKVQKTDGI